MRVGILTIVFAVIIAVALNTTLAWICALLPTKSYDSDGFDYLDASAQEWWSQHAPPHWEVRPESVSRHPTFGFHSILYIEYLPQQGLRSPSTVSRMYTGLPFRCFYGEVWVDMALRTANAVNNPHVNLGWLQGRVPLRPLLLPTLANTTIYTGALLAIYLLFGRLRRHLRRRRGLCVACGYHLQSSQACPECGLRSVA